MNRSHAEYLEALTVARPHIGRAAVRRLATQVTVIQEPTMYTFVAKLVYRGSENMDKRHLCWHMDRGFPDIKYKVERLEIMLGLVCLSEAKLYDLSETELHHRAHQLGCDYSLLDVTRERWRRIMARRVPSDGYLLSELDDRPLCRVCHTRRVASGHSKPDIHDDCWEYVHSVMIPALKQQREVKHATG